MPAERVEASGAATTSAATVAADARAKRDFMAILCARTLHFDQKLGEFLFAFGLVLAGFGFGELRDVHGAEFRAAHGAEFRFLVEIVGKRFVVHGASGFWVEGKLELFVPVEKEA